MSSPSISSNGQVRQLAKAEGMASYTSEHERPVDPWKIDLANLSIGGVAEPHARTVAKLYRLTRQGEGSGDHRLRRDDGGQGGQEY